MFTELAGRDFLIRSESGRWVLDDHDLTCGSCIQVRVAGSWIDISIEHNGHDYVAVPKAIRLYQGLPARFCRPALKRPRRCKLPRGFGVSASTSAEDRLVAPLRDK